MPCLPGHRSARLRPLIILAEVAAFVFALSLIALSHPSLTIWLVAVLSLLLHTILFYRLGRISESARSGPSPGFIDDLRQMLTGGSDKEFQGPDLPEAGG